VQICGENLRILLIGCFQSDHPQPRRQIEAGSVRSFFEPFPLIAGHTDLNQVQFSFP